MCYQDILPTFINQYKDKLPANPKIDDIISNWDNLKPKENMIDLCGCLLPKESHVKAGPNARRFLVRPSEHANATNHGNENKVKKRKREEISMCSKQTTLDIASNGTVSTSKQATLVSDKNTSTITLKHGRRLKMARIDKI